MKLRNTWKLKQNASSLQKTQPPKVLSKIKSDLGFADLRKEVNLSEFLKMGNSSENKEDYKQLYNDSLCFTVLNMELHEQNDSLKDRISKSKTEIIDLQKRLDKLDTLFLFTCQNVEIIRENQILLKNRLLKEQ